MKPDSWKDELLKDVLSEAAPPAMREDSLHQMLGAVQHRRRQRRTLQSLAAAACLLAVIGLAVRFISQPSPSALNGPSPLLVHSQTLSPGTLVTTQPGTMEVVNSSGAAVAFVEPLTSTELFEFIGDEKLLALLAGRPAALVHHGASVAELVFLHPADADGFQIP